jgi:hypothetical protein
MSEKASRWRYRRSRGASLIGLAALTCVAAVLAHACGEDGSDITEPETPVSGKLLVTLISPNGPEGAAVLETEDRGVLRIDSSSGQAFLGGTQRFTRVVVLLTNPGRIEVTLEVEDLNDPPQLSVVEVADGSNTLRGDLGDYSLDVRQMGGFFDTVGGGR